MNGNKSCVQILNRIIAIASVVLATIIEPRLNRSLILAQTDEFNPLETTTPDPLLPNPPVKRPLSPLERFRLKETLDELDKQAAAQLEAGKEQEAFTIWYRVLRLQRELDRLGEVRALGKIGAIAWERSRSADVKIITQRLQAVEQEVSLQGTLDPVLLTAFGQAYQQIREVNKALEIYQQILANVRQQEDKKTTIAALKTIGQLYLAKFDYTQGAAIYEQLLSLARQQQDHFSQGLYLRQLAEIYNQALQPENALRIKQQLLEDYLKNEQIDRLPTLKISIASDYEALKQPEQASQNYQEAFELARSWEQFAAATEALEKLANLYLAYEQKNFALEIYQRLLQLEQQSYNFYGLMNTYDRIGQIYLEQENYSQALEAFEQGLAIASSLKYQQTYFRDRIQLINEQLDRSN
ncbi:MAG: tetratricopeptide repeat protein [Prochloraceae cyanobacterium]